MTEDRNPGSGVRDNCELYWQRAEEVRKLAMMADEIHYEQSITGPARRELARVLADNEGTRLDIISTLKHLAGACAGRS